VTQGPIPANHRVVVMAVTTGQEPFVDTNGNGTWDPGEMFTDLPPEPFLNCNESVDAQGNPTFDAGEFFIDSNNNGVRDNAGNGQWDDQILISVSGPIVFSGHAQVSIAPVNGAPCTPDDGDCFMLGPGESKQFTVTVSDEAGQPLVAGTTIMFTGVNVNVSPTQITLPDTDLMPGPGVTEFTVTLTNPPSTPAPAPSGGSPGPTSTPSVQPASLTVDVTSGGGGTGGSSTQCPGSNGNASETIDGTVVR